MIEELEKYNLQLELVLSKLNSFFKYRNIGLIKCISEFYKNDLDKLKRKIKKIEDKENLINA